MTQIVPATKEVDFEDAARKLTDAAEKVEVKDGQSFRAACLLLRKVRTQVASVQNACKAEKDRCHKAHREACDEERRLLGLLPESDKSLVEKLRAYLFEKDADLQWVQDTKPGDNEALLEVMSDLAPKVGGIIVSKKWTAEVTDFKQLLRGVCAGNVDIDFLQPNQKRLDEWAAQVKGDESSAIPGVVTNHDYVIKGRKIET